MTAAKTSVKGKTATKPVRAKAVSEKAARADDGRQLLKVREAAFELNVSPRTAWKYVWESDPEKRLESIWIGGRRFVPRQAITAYMQRLCMQQGARDTYRLMAS